jgi:hypothetical protein
MASSRWAMSPFRAARTRAAAAAAVVVVPDGKLPPPPVPPARVDAVSGDVSDAGRCVVNACAVVPTAGWRRQAAKARFVS